MGHAGRVPRFANQSNVVLVAKANLMGPAHQFFFLSSRQSVPVHAFSRAPVGVYSSHIRSSPHNKGARDLVDILGVGLDDASTGSYWTPLRGRKVDNSFD